MSSQEGKTRAMHRYHTFLPTMKSSRLLLAISILSLLSCSDKTRTNLKKADELTIGLNQEPDTLWPALGSMMAGSEIKTLLGLNSQTAMTVTDDKWKIRPFLAGYRPQPDAPLQIPRLENGGMENPVILL